MRLLVGSIATLTLVLGSFPAAAAAQGQRPLPQVLDAADLAWKAGRYADALLAYEEVVRQDSTAAIAVFRLATLLGWRQELDRAIGLLHHYRRLLPSDDDGRVALARTFAWNGRYDQSLALYDSVLTTNPGHREAVLGAAQTLAWRGDLQGAIARYEAWLRDAPADADGWVGLAQVRRWAGQPAAARVALRTALGAEPRHAEALTQLASVDAMLSPSLEPAIISTNDSDDNRGTTYSMDVGVPAPWSARLALGARYRTADLATMQGTALTLRGASSWTPTGGAWTIRGEVGATRLGGHDAGGAPMSVRTEPLAGARLSGAIARRLILGLGVTRAALDETATSILEGIATTSVEGSADLTLHPRVTLSGSGEVASLRGGATPNGRAAAAGALRWSLGHGMTAAAGARMVAYERAASDGYFAPERYLLADASIRVESGAELGWRFGGEVGLGHQRISVFDGPGDARLAQRATAVLGYGFSPAVEWRLSGSFANVASPATSTSAEYRAWAISLGGRLGL